MKGVYLVTDEKACLGRPLEKIVEAAVKGGISCLQLREKKADTRSFLKTALRLKEICQEAKIPFLINDRIDIALACQADGVHLGQSDMPVQTARKILGPEAIIGLSVESWDEVEEAETLPIDYIGVSPVFETPTKTDTKTAWGLEGLAKIRVFSKHPLVAIGGINQTNAHEVTQAGAHSIAVVSAICSADDPAHAVECLRRQGDDPLDPIW